jgi:hypothetical protein
VTTLVVKKVDFDTATALAGATFQLWLDNGTTPGVLDSQDTKIGGPEVTGADGLVTWGDLLNGTHLIVQETAAPDGYTLPNPAEMSVIINETNFVSMGEMSQILFRDPAGGQLVLLPKQEFWDSTPGKPNTATWTPVTVAIPYGSALKYQIGVQATGKKLFHDVTVTDYVPGYNPADTTTTQKAVYLAEYKHLKTTCIGFTTCTTSYDSSTGLVTWKLGDLTNVSGTVVFYVKLPGAPKNLDPGTYSQTYWNQAHLTWTENVPGYEGPKPGNLDSNQVVAKTLINVLPKHLAWTGLSPLAQWGGLLGGSMLILGARLVIAEIRRRRMSD